jgi:trimeric autotransporter adhesin
MKNISKTFVFFLFSFFYSLNSSAQAPSKISFQAVVRNTSNALVTNSPVGIRINILRISLTGVLVFSETHTVMTNSNGLASLEIGTGTAITGSLSSINWALGPYFMTTSIDITGGTTYTISSSNELLSVPYALYAKNAETATNNWAFVGNTVSATDFIGSTNNADIAFKRNNFKSGLIGLNNTTYGYKSYAFGSSTGLYNTAIGVESLISNQGTANTAIGYESLYFNTTGNLNTAVGMQSLTYNTTGIKNTANGANSLKSNTFGNNNTANGFESLFSNTNGINNTASGINSLHDNTNGVHNTAFGSEALYKNQIGYNNTAVGSASLWSNISGVNNTANGYLSLYNNTTGNENNASGYGSLYNNTTGQKNTAFGFRALEGNTTGSNNIAIGSNVLTTNSAGFYNIAIGTSALSTHTFGDQNLALGWNALSNQITGGNNIGIGTGAVVPSSTSNNQIRLGNTNITYAGIQVAWSITSDRRWKSDIQKSDLGLNFIKKLNPVSYYRNNDENKKIEYGFIAQEIENALIESKSKDNGIITKDDAGMLSVRYNDLLAPMVKAIQEQQVIIERLQQQIIDLQNKK